MSSLSILKEGVFVTCANPIYLTCDLDWRDGVTLSFEIFVADATSLKSRLGEVEQYCLDSQASFWGKLTILEPCQSTHPGLRLLRHKPTLRGVLTILTLNHPTAIKH
jgi:hypothetical protein